MTSIVVVAVVIGISCLMVPVPAFAGVKEAIATVLGWIFWFVLYLIGKLILLLIDLVVKVAQYNDFIKSTAVQMGWTIVRDVCNLAFIVILLVIAFGTVLNIQSYHYKNTLMRFVIVVVLINFSRTISGFFIDMAQVVMMTFVNAFKDTAAGNITQAGGLNDLLNFRNQVTKEQGDINLFEVIGSLILGLLLALGLMLVLLLILVILISRIVMLWLLVVLSPLAYLGSIFPGGGGKGGGGALGQLSTQWWQYFGKYVVIGPLLAFFLWLSLSIMSSTRGQLSNEVINESTTLKESEFTTGSADTEYAAALTTVSRSGNILSYVLSIGMLIAAMMITQQAGVMGGQFAGKAMGIMAGAGMFVAKAPFKSYEWGARKIKAGALPGGRLKGIEFNPVNAYRLIRGGMERKKQREISQGLSEAGARLEKGGVRGYLLGMGAPSHYDNFAQGWFYNRGVKRFFGNIMQGKRQGQLDQVKGKIDQGLEAYSTPERRAQKTEEIRNQLEGADREEELITQAAHQGKDYKNMSPDDRFSFKDEYAKQLATEGVREDYLKTKEGASLGARGQKLEAATLKWAMLRPQDYIARQEMRKTTDEEAKKYSTASEDELMASYRAAVDRRDLVASSALAVQAFRARHGNELVNDKVADHSYYRNLKTGTLVNEAEKGKEEEEAEKKGQAAPQYTTIVEKDHTLPADYEGLSIMIREDFMDKQHLGKQPALMLQSDLSDIAQEVDHWNMAQSVGAKPWGEYYQRPYWDTQQRIGTERGKADFENLWRRQNRLGIMSERWKDDNDHSKGRVATLMPFAVRELEVVWDKMLNNLERGRFNVSVATQMFSNPENVKILREIRQLIAQQHPEKLDDFDKRFYAKMSEMGAAGESLLSAFQRVAGQMEQAGIKVGSGPAPGSTPNTG